MDKDRTARKIWPSLDRRRTATLFEHQRSRLSTVIGAITEHCIIGTHARRIALGHLANHFCRICGKKEENETILHLLCLCPVLGHRREISRYIVHFGFR